MLQFNYVQTLFKQAFRNVKAMYFDSRQILPSGKSDRYEFELSKALARKDKVIYVDFKRKKIKGVQNG